MFKLYLLSVDALSNIIKVRNQVVVKKNGPRRYSTKDWLFDIFSIANQLYQSKSIIPEELKPSKIYFSKNPTSNLILDGLKVLLTQVEAFNKFIKDNKPIEI